MGRSCPVSAHSIMTTGRSEHRTKKCMHACEWSKRSTRHKVVMVLVGKSQPNGPATYLAPLSAHRRMCGCGVSQTQHGSKGTRNVSTLTMDTGQSRQPRERYMRARGSKQSDTHRHGVSQTQSVRRGRDGRQDIRGVSQDVGTHGVNMHTWMQIMLDMGTHEWLKQST